MIQVSKRQEKLLYCLQNKEIMTCQELASLLHVSMKTVRNDIADLNRQAKEPIITSLRGKGYVLHPSDEIPIQEVQIEENSARNLLILKHILSNEENNFYEVADAFYISESTLDKAITALNNDIKKRTPELQIQRKNNILFIDSSEEKKRQLYTQFLMHEMDDYNFDLKKYTNYFNSCNINDLKQYVLSFNANQNLQMRDFEILSFILHIATMIERVNKGNSISHIDNYQIDEQSKILASLFHKGLNKRFSITLSDSEEHYLASLFTGKITTYNSDKLDEYCLFINQMLLDIKQQYNIDFQNDEEFYENLLVHLIGLDARIQNNQFLNNPLIADIKLHFPLVYDMSVYIALKIQTFFNAKLIEDEIGYIALHIMCAFEKIRQQNYKKVVIVTPLGKASANFITNKLLTMSINIEVTATLSMFDLNRINEYKPDLVISTVPITNPGDIKVYTCNTVITKEDLNAIYQILRPKKKTATTSFFHESLFFVDQDFKTKEEVIHFLCQEIEKQGFCKENYESLVLQREQLAPTAYGNLFAIPHPIERVASKNGIAICTIKQPIDWVSQKVRIVFLFSISSQNDKNFEELFENLISLLNDISKVKKMLKAKDFNTFIDIFNA